MTRAMDAMIMLAGVPDDGAETISRFGQALSSPAACAGAPARYGVRQAASMAASLFPEILDNNIRLLLSSDRMR